MRRLQDFVADVDPVPGESDEDLVQDDLVQDLDAVGLHHLDAIAAESEHPKCRPDRSVSMGPENHPNLPRAEQPVAFHVPAGFGELAVARRAHACVARKAEEVQNPFAHGLLGDHGRGRAREVFHRQLGGAEQQALVRLGLRQATLIPSPAVASGEIGEELVSADDLQRRVRELGAEISRDYADKDLVLIGVLKGAVFFLADLMRAMDIQSEVDFMAVASYGSSTDSSGVVRILKDLDANIEGRDVLIVEDIVDSGLTLSYLMRSLKAREPRSVEVCALLTKPERRQVELPIRYIGFEIPNRFVIGYGLDHAELYRNLPHIAVLDE